MMKADFQILYHSIIRTEINIYSANVAQLLTLLRLYGNFKNTVYFKSHKYNRLDKL